MKALMSLAGVMALMCLLAGCNLPSSVPVIGDRGAGTVSDLWPDVPPMPSATKNDLGAPTLQIKLVSTLLFGGAPLDYIFFITPKSLQEVRDFYTIDRMAATGWDRDIPGCDLDKVDKYKDIAKQFTDGWVCFFGKKQGEQTRDLLLIIIVPDAQTKQTQVVYGRIKPASATPTK
jgi:hypothetical protein